jgi:hypothetical protein
MVEGVGDMKDKDYTLMRLKSRVSHTPGRVGKVCVQGGGKWRGSDTQ